MTATIFHFSIRTSGYAVVLLPATTVQKSIWALNLAYRGTKICVGCNHVLVYDVLKVLMSDLFKMLNTSTLPVTVVRPNFILREARKSTLFRDGENCVPGSMSAIEAMLPEGLRLSAALISAADGVYSAVICGPGTI
jgi:hypothetical protein